MDLKVGKHVDDKMKKTLDVAGERMITVLEKAVERIDVVLALPLLWKDILRGRTGEIERLLGPICVSNMLRLRKLVDYQDGWIPSPSFMESTSRDDPEGGGLLEGGHGGPGDESLGESRRNWNKQIQGQGGGERRRILESLIENHPRDFYFLTDLLHLREEGGESFEKFSILKLVKESLKSRYEDHVKKALGERDVKSLFCILSLVAGAKEDGAEGVEKLTKLMDQMWKTWKDEGGKGKKGGLLEEKRGRDDRGDAKKIPRGQVGGQVGNEDDMKSGGVVKQIHKADCKRFNKMKMTRRGEKGEGGLEVMQIPSETLSSTAMYSTLSEPRDDPLDTRSEFSKAWNPKYSYKPQESFYVQQDTEDTTLDSEILAILKKDASRDKDEGKYQLPLDEAGNSLDNFESIIFDRKSGRDSKDTQLSGVRDSYTFQNSLTTRRPTIADLPLTSTDTNKAKSSPSTTQTPSCSDDASSSSSHSPRSSRSFSSGSDGTSLTEISIGEVKEIKKIFSQVCAAITNNVHLMRLIHARAGFDRDGDEGFECFKGLENVKLLLLHLIPLIQQKLMTPLKEEMKLADLLREKWKNLHRRARELEGLQHEFIRLRKESRPVLLSLDFQIKILQSRLSQIAGENFEQLREIIRETELCAAIEEKGENLKLRTMEKNLRNLEVAAISTESQIGEKRKQLVERQDSLNEQLTQEIARYDKKMFEVQQELDDAIEESRQCKINVGKHQKQYEDIQSRFIDMKAAKKLKQILRNAQVADEMKRHKAAALIQATWRKYKIRKRKKERKRAKKGKKKHVKK